MVGGKLAKIYQISWVMPRSLSDSTLNGVANTNNHTLVGAGHVSLICYSCDISRGVCPTAFGSNRGTLTPTFLWGQRRCCGSVWTNAWDSDTLTQLEPVGIKKKVQSGRRGGGMRRGEGEVGKMSVGSFGCPVEFPPGTKASLWL